MASSSLVTIALIILGLMLIFAFGIKTISDMKSIQAVDSGIYNDSLKGENLVYGFGKTFKPIGYLSIGIIALILIVAVFTQLGKGSAKI